MLLFFNVGGCPGIIPDLSAKECSCKSPGRGELALVSFRGLRPDIPASAKPLGCAVGTSGWSGVRKIKLLRWGLSFCKFPHWRVRSPARERWATTTDAREYLQGE